ncbi:MAG TPA: glycosyltransferase [Kofleriaceae bacterium]
MAPRASLVICTRNRSAFLARTLASLVGQTERDFEVVLVDDGSEDDTREVARAWGERLDLRYLRRAHVGIAGARNAAMRAAKGDVLISTDDDRIAAPAFVADHVAAHAVPERRVGVGRQRALFAEWARDAAYTAADVAAFVAAHPDLAPRLVEPRAVLVTPEQLLADLPGTLAAFELAEPWWTSYAARVIATWGEPLAGFAFPWTLGVGGNTSVLRALADEVGLLDDRFVGWGLEDADFHYRLHLAGARTYVIPGGVNYHQVHRRGPELAGEWLRNAHRLLEKHAAPEVILYLWVCRGRFTLERANELAAACTDNALAGELVRTLRDHFALLR